MFKRLTYESLSGENGTMEQIIEIRKKGEETSIKILNLFVNLINNPNTIEVINSLF